LQDMPNGELMRQGLSADFDTNIRNLRILLNLPKNEDVKFREYQANGFRICAVYVEGMANEDRIAEFVLHALKNSTDVSRTQSESNAEFLNRAMIEVAQTSLITENAEAVQKIIAGMTCVLVEGCGEAIAMETRNYPHRGVEKPTSETVVSGAQEGFNEHLRTNISLIRRYVQSPELISEKISVGTKIAVQVSMLYLEGVASETCLSEVRRRLKSIRSTSVFGSGDIEQLIEDRPFALLPQILQTERPDRAAAAIKDGQIVLLVENSPYALVMPVTVFHLIHASDDSFMRWQYGSFLRIIRMLGLAISLTLPALYVAVTLFHTHLIPMPLLASIAESRVNVPFPIVVEVLFMEFSFFLLNEAGVRIPSQIGSALGIVGALILGQAAVSASVISPILIIITAITGLGGYAVPNYGFGLGISIYRLGLIFLSALLGMYGLIIGLFLIFAQLCSMKSFGVPYLSPLAPRRRHNPDIILRLPVWMQKRLMFFADQDSWMKQKKMKGDE